MSWMALDIGGANIKLATCDGATALSVPFPMWTRWQELGRRIREMLAEAPPLPLAVTMTAELADCFATKAEGVRYVVEAVETAESDRAIRYYRLGGTLTDAKGALAEPLEIAAANWHALALWAAPLAGDATGLLIDIGSTTTDVIPLNRARPIAEGRNDPQRLVAGELVYTGVERSPICALARSLPWRGAECPTAAELFATTLDAYLTLGELPEDPQYKLTADGRAATREAARDRLARSICADRTLFDESDASAAALAIREAQLAKIGQAASEVVERLGSVPAMVILAGQGEFLGRRLVVRLGWASQVVSLSERLGERLSRVAPAYALANLAAQWNGSCES